MKDFTIPMLETSAKRHRLEESFSTTSSSSKESSESDEVLAKIDFSRFPKNICNCTEEELEDMTEQLNENLTKIQNELADIVNPNLKVYNTFIILHIIHTCIFMSDVLLKINFMILNKYRLMKKSFR